MRLLSWMDAAPHRGPVLNIVMLVLLLGMIGNTALLLCVGAATIAVSAIGGLRRAMRAMASPDRSHLPLDRIAIWLPGATALGMCAVALLLIVENPASSVAHSLGLVLFAFELVMLVLPSERPSTAGVSKG
ncbi:MAG: hypothetical protein KIS73_12615 [Enhydrobacter sp.]|nr:hypothetical protein [Enhydrobacter sp.]